MTSEMQQLGKYKIIAEVGYGGYATVYRAVDSTLDREVALKVLKPQLLADTIFVQRFEQEARTLAQLRHPNIVTVFEVGQAEGRLFIAMEFARGPSLADRIAEQNRISWSETLLLLNPVCDALDYAHTQEVVHRDLKPSNILLDEDIPMISDFGFARILGQSSMSLSMSGGIVGTPGYIAPEVWEYNKATPATDIYALGCVVHELLTGDVLFTGETPMQVMRAHDRGPQFPEEWPDDVPAGIDAVLRKALDAEPAQRYRDAKSFLYALEEAEKQVAHEEFAALVARWRGEVETAIDAGEWRVARMAIGRWHALKPNDPALEKARARLETRTDGDRPGSDTTNVSEADKKKTTTTKVSESSGAAGKKRDTVSKSVRTPSKPTTTYSRRKYGRSTEESLSTTSNLQIWVQWILAHIVGLPAAGLLAEASSDHLSDLPGALALVFLPFFIAIVVLPVGASQWYVLRSHLPDGGRWGLATFAGFVLASTGSAMSFLREWEWTFVFGSIVGIVFALPQWYILRRHVSDAGWWLIANGAGVGLGYAIISEPLQDASDTSEFILLAALFGGIAAAVTGAVLVWLLNQSTSGRSVT